VNGGLGDAICHVLSGNYLAPVEIIGVNDTFGESGTPEQLLEKYGLTSSNIVAAAEKVMARKNIGNGVGIHA
jgi:transketolase